MTLFCKKTCWETWVESFFYLFWIMVIFIEFFLGDQARRLPLENYQLLLSFMLCLDDQFSLNTWCYALCFASQLLIPELYPLTYLWVCFSHHSFWCFLNFPSEVHTDLASNVQYLNLIYVLLTWNYDLPNLHSYAHTWFHYDLKKNYLDFLNTDSDLHWTSHFEVPMIFLRYNLKCF